MITTTGLELRAGARILLSDAALRVQPGDRIGLVGRNGAGKTTTLTTLAGERLPHAGSVEVTGEIGYLPVPGVPLPEDIRTEPGRLPSLAGGLQSLVSAEAVTELARGYGFAAGSATECVKVAVEAGAEGEPLLDEIAHRLALGVAAVCVILDPGLVVLAGEVSLTADVTATAFAELGLVPGAQVWASVKASEVAVYPR